MPGAAMLPTLVGERVRLRPGTGDDVAVLREILAEPSVARWWREPKPHDEIGTDLAGQDGTYLLVVEVAGAVVGRRPSRTTDTPASISSSPTARRAGASAARRSVYWLESS